MQIKKENESAISLLPELIKWFLKLKDSKKISPG